MKHIASVFLFILLSVSITNVRAALIEVDLVAGSGDKLITRDTLTNLDWLDLSESLGRNFNDVSTQFGIGGDFEGWRYATSSNVEDLWLNAGITNIDGGAIAANVFPIQGLFDLIGGTTLSPPNRVFAQASTAESSTMFPGNLIAPILVIDGGTGNARIQGGAVTANHTDPTVSNWLVRGANAVPAPSAFLLMGSGLIGLVGWRWWSRKTA